MWVIDDEAMDMILGGKFFMVLDMARKKKNIPVKDLYCMQFEYESYDGFRKFFNKRLRPIVNRVKYVSSNNIIGKLLNIIAKR